MNLILINDYVIYALILIYFISFKMAKKNSKFQKFLKSVGLISGSGGIAGLILAISGICLPCVLIPLGFVWAWLLFVFSFVSIYKWWFVWASVVSLILALSLKRITVCKDWVCKVDKKHKNKIGFSFSNFRSNLSKLNNWKTYVLIPIMLLFVALLFTLSISRNKSGELDMDAMNIIQSDPYINMVKILPTKWSDDAKVTIIEYSDYFCPGCLPFYEDVIEPIIEKYGNEVRLISVQVNVLMNLWYSSVHAAFCADEQWKYWEIHNKLLERMRPFVDREKNWDLANDMFKVSEEWTSEYFTKIAESIEGIDTQKFLDCMETDKYSKKIEIITNSFQRLGFSWVPVVLINGKYFDGYPTQENLSRVIDEIVK